MTPLRVRFYWHTDDTEDVDLGEGWLDVLPPVDALITVQSPQTPQVVWRVAQLYINPAQYGSTTWRAAVERGERRQVCIYTVFVEPADGPFHQDLAEPEGVPE